jgi:hypothetical protein
MELAKQSTYAKITSDTFTKQPLSKAEKNSMKAGRSKKSLFSTIGGAMTADFKRQETAQEEYLLGIDNDLIQLFTWSKGRVRFGDIVNGSRGENISGNWLTFTSSATPNAENTITHKVGAIPIGYLVVQQDKAGSLYNGTTVWSDTKLYLKCSVASVTFKIFLLK